MTTEVAIFTALPGKEEELGDAYRKIARADYRPRFRNKSSWVRVEIHS